MNTETLTAEQTARVFGMYLGCDVHDDYDNDIKILYSVTCDTVVYLLKKTQHKRTLPEVKLLLTPLSAISDEDAVAVSKIHHPELQHISRKKRLANGFEIFNVNGFAGYISWSRLENLAVQYLIQRGYAVPLFISPGHPDNGKTAIELGIALDRTNQTSKP